MRVAHSVSYFKNISKANQSFSIRENELLFLIRKASDDIDISDEATAATSTSHGFTVGAAATVGAIDVG